MPTFGEFETVGEPLARVEERGHVSTVWKAKKAGDAAPLYVVKCYTPRRRLPEPGEEDTVHLHKDRGLEFLDGIKQAAKAIAEGGLCLAPIHGLGTSDEGAWYATDFYPRNNLRSYIDRRGGVDGLALRHVLYEVVSACLALKRSRGYSHGNLKPSNVFLAGKVRPLRETPMRLTDPYPASPLQLAALDAGDRREVDELLHQVIEAHDLRSVGELILQLVEGRLFSRPDDYNYPVHSSPAWNALGKDAAYWLKKCNELVDPSLSLENMSLEKLEAEFRPTFVEQNRTLIIRGAAIAGVAAIAMVIGIYFLKQWERSREEARKKAQAEFNQAVAAGDQLLASEDYAKAVVEFQKAGIAARQLDLTNRNAAGLSEQFASALAQAKAAGTVEDEIKSLEAALKVRSDAKTQTRLADAKRRKEREELALLQTQKQKQLESTLAEGNRLLAQENYAQASVSFQTAADLAQALDRPEQRKAAEDTRRYAAALAQAGAAVSVGDEIKFLEEALSIRREPKVQARLDDAKRRRDQGEKEKTLAQKKAELDNALAAGDRLLGTEDYAQAMVEFEKAVQLAAQLSQPDKGRLAAEGKSFAGALAQAKAAGSIDDEIKFLGDALKVRTDAKVQAQLTEARRRKAAEASRTAEAQKKAELEKALAEGNRLLGTNDYAQAAVLFQRAAKLAGELNQPDKVTLAGEGQRYANALAQAKAATVIEEEISSLEGALKLRSEPKVQAWLADAKQRKDRRDKQNEIAKARGQASKALENSEFTAAQPPLERALLLAGQIKDTNAITGASRRLSFAKDMVAAGAVGRTNSEGSFQQITNALYKWEKDLAVPETVGAKRLAKSLATNACDRALAISNVPTADSWLAQAQGFGATEGELKPFRDRIAALRPKPPGPQPPPPPGTTAGARPLEIKVQGIDLVWVRQLSAYVSKYEISRDQYRSIVGGVPGSQSGTDERPVHLSDLNAANALCDALNKSPNRPGTFQLPSVEQYLVLAGLDAKKDFDPGPGQVLSRDAFQRVQSNENAGKGMTGHLENAAVGKPSPLGLFNVLGNALEWTAGGQVVGLRPNATAASTGRTLVNRPEVCLEQLTHPGMEQAIALGVRPIMIPR